MDVMLGAVEAGGSKFICAVGSWPDEVVERIRIRTAAPAETLAHAARFFLRHHRETPLSAIGIGSFGPIDLERGSSTYGYITSTPKPGWTNTDIVGRLQDAVDAPIGFDTDVNTAGLGEFRWGAGRGLDCLVYLTVGTGIGGGAIVGGRPLHGASHPEMGHAHTGQISEADSFEGACPFHGDCLEGLASGPAIQRRWGRPPESLADDHAAWRLEAEYLASGVANIVVTLSPQRVIMGGGVMRRRRLFPMIRARVLEMLRGYGITEEIERNMDEYIVPPALGDDAGLAGAFALAESALLAREDVA